MEAEFKSILDAVRAIKIGMKTLEYWDDIYLVANEKEEIYVVCDDPGQFKRTVGVIVERIKIQAGM